MTDLAKDTAAIDAINLLTHYGFDLGGYTAERLVEQWLNHYPSLWVRAAVVEALYQGRYKAISVEQILSLWLRRGQLFHHYNHEFERIVCGRFPRNLRLPKPSKREINRIPPQAEPPAVAEPFPPAPLPERLPQRENSSQPSTAQQPLAKDEIALSNASASGSVVLPNEIDRAIEPGVTKPADPPEMQRLSNSASDTAPVLSDQSSRSVNNQPIHQFVPATAPSDFYAKLKAVASSDGADLPFVTVSDSDGKDAP